MVTWENYLCQNKPRYKNSNKIAINWGLYCNHTGSAIELAIENQTLKGSQYRFRNHNRPKLAIDYNRDCNRIGELMNPEAFLKLAEGGGIFMTKTKCTFRYVLISKEQFTFCNVFIYKNPDTLRHIFICKK